MHQAHKNSMGSGVSTRYVSGIRYWYLVQHTKLGVPKYRTINSCRANHRLPTPYLAVLLTLIYGLPIADADAVHGIVASLVYDKV